MANQNFHYVIMRGYYVRGDYIRLEELPYMTNDHEAADRRIRSYAEVWRYVADIVQHNAGESVVYFANGERFEYWRETRLHSH